MLVYLWVQGREQEHTFVFQLSSSRECKHLWKCAVERHAFFRLRQPTHNKSNRSDFTRIGSRFRFRCVHTRAPILATYLHCLFFKFCVVCVCSGRTEYQATHSGKVRRASTFERRPSKRYPSRAQSMVKGRSVCCVPYLLSIINLMHFWYAKSLSALHVILKPLNVALIHVAPHINICHVYMIAFVFHSHNSSKTSTSKVKPHKHNYKHLDIKACFFCVYFINFVVCE